MLIVETSPELNKAGTLKACKDAFQGQHHTFFPEEDPERSQMIEVVNVYNFPYVA